MNKQISPNEEKRAEAQISTHLLMAGVVTVFNVMLIMVTLTMSWELWTIPLAVLGVLVIWAFHIGEMVSETLYEHLCVGFLLVEFFYYGAHADSLFNMPIMLSVLLFMLALLDKKYLLYLTVAMYALELLYHIFILRTVNFEMAVWDFVCLGIGVAAMAAAMVLSGYMVKRRSTDKKQYEQMAAQLETANQKNADFLSNISHELRTPINMVMGLSEVALGQEIPAGLRESLQSINLAGKRLAGQINDILDYTEIVGGTLAVTRENYILSSIVNDVATVAAEQNGSKRLEIVFDMDAGIPSVLIGDAEKLSRVLRILIQNAIKFTEEGGVYVRIGHRRESYGVNLDITICDTGIGLTEEQLRRIGEDFYQADSGSSRYAGGLGLGIPIAQGLLSKMEGFMHFESKEKEGTQVHVIIPQGVADAAPGMAVSNPGKFCIGCYFKRGKYSRSQVREFYDNMFLHLTEGLGVEGYRVYEFEDVDKMLCSHNLTHLFIGQEEYEDDTVYYEELGKKICVALLVHRGYFPPKESCLIPLYLPLYALPIVNLLNGDAGLAAEHTFTCFGVRALVVDDEEMNLVVARGILSSYGMRVDTCISGRAAIEQCTNKTYDIVFLDHMMPGLDGIETLKRIREINNGAYQNLAIIALTANAISGAREIFKGEGFTEFVPKPIERSVLERVLRSVLPEQLMQYGGAAGNVLPGGYTKSGSPVKPNQSGLSGSFAQFNQPKASGLSVQSNQPGSSGLSVQSNQFRSPGSLEQPNQSRSSDSFAQPNQPGPSGLSAQPNQSGTSDSFAQPNQLGTSGLSAQPSQPGLSGLSAQPNQPGPSGSSVQPNQFGQSDYSVQSVQSVESKLSKPMEYLRRAGINVDLGLTYCGGMEEFYMEMLQMFYDQSIERRAEIVALYEQENWQDYAIKVHALKSTSLTIGAEQLSERAKSVELAGKGGDVAYIRENHSALLHLYDTVCKNIVGCRGRIADPGKDAGQEGGADS